MNEPRRRIRIHIQGRVQGVGFRPFVWNRAASLGLSGWVLNDSSGVTIEIQGTAIRVANFLDGLDQASPSLATIDSLTAVDIAAVDETQFVIRESKGSDNESTPVVPDSSICDDCLREMNDQNDRRFGYPFINCTQCGPRFTIIEDVPYDRKSTTMKKFDMCPQCRSEYDDPSNRRFHAQPNACWHCGPVIWFESAARLCTRVIDAFSSEIREGRIVAVKGVGGFHLACDATNRETVQRLRERKGRTDKPFAVMVADVGQAESFAMVNDHERRLLESKERPIVLVRKRKDRVVRKMLDAVAPGNNFVGVMLPYSPLHVLLAQSTDPLVMTSGNVSEEPIVHTNTEAINRLSAIADSFLLHDRDINVCCDDSVMRCIDQRVLPIRRSRGYAPMPVILDEVGPSVLAVGGEMKSTFCVTKGAYAYISQHIGDVGNIETLDALRRNVEHYLKLFRIDVEAVAADLHPGYLSSQWAAELAELLSVPLIGVQHHFSHAVSLRSEHTVANDQPIIACCFDGTGYGTDGAIWGGEFMIAGDRNFQRIAHLKYFHLPGGDTSVKSPYRAALAILHQYGLPWDDQLPCVSASPSNVRSVLRQQLDKRVNCVLTSSVGRLFDAVASLIGIRHEINYEAQAAIEMEALASEVIDDWGGDDYSFDAMNTQPIEIDCGNLLRSICRDVMDGIDRPVIAARFHHAVAKMVTEVCLDAKMKTGINTVGLTGGVFQNVLLLKLVARRLQDCGFHVLTHALVPPNDGGLALGQAIVARNRLSVVSQSSSCLS